MNWSGWKVKSYAFPVDLSLETLFKKICFIYFRKREREHERKEGERERIFKKTPHWVQSLMWGLPPRPWDCDLTKPTESPRHPNLEEFFFKLFNQKIIACRGLIWPHWFSDPCGPCFAYHIPWSSSKFWGGIAIDINLLQEEIKGERKTHDCKMMPGDTRCSLHWQLLWWPKGLISNCPGYSDWIQLKIWILLYPEACYVTQDRQYVGTGNTTNIRYNYTTNINDPNSVIWMTLFFLKIFKDFKDFLKIFLKIF